MTTPRLARGLLSICARAVDRQSLLDELELEFVRLRESKGAPEARRWYWRQACSSALPLLADRVRRQTGRLRLPAGLGTDLRHSLRTVVRQRTVTVLVVSSLAVASGATLASWMVADAVLIAPLPFPQPDRLVRLRSTGPAIPANVRTVSFQDLEDWRRLSTSLAAVSAFTSVSANMTGLGDARRLEGMRIGRDFDRTLGFQPAVGRLFVDADFAPGAEPVIVLTDSFWSRQFSRDPRVIDQRLTLDEQSWRIVGVVASMSMTYPAAPHDFWRPLVPREGARWEWSRDTGWIESVARLKPGVTLSVATQELSAVAQRLAEAHPETNADRPAMALEPLRDVIIGDARPALLLVAAATLALLLVAYGNSLHLLVAQAVSRRPEFSVRLALGAGRARLARHAFLEAAILSATAVGLGLAVAPLMLQGLDGLPDSAIPRRGEIAVFPTGLAWSGALAAATALVLGWPLVRMALRLPLTIDSGSARATGGRADRRARGVLVATQVALSVVLVLGGVLFVDTLRQLESVDLGFSPERVVTLQATPSRTAAPNAGRTLEFYRAGLERIAALPGVTHVAASTAAPFVVSGWSFGVSAQGASPGDARHIVRVVVASPKYFETLGIPLIDGRLLSDEEHRHAPDVTVISKKMARLLFGDAPAIGQSVDYSGRRWSVTGVVADTRLRVNAPADAMMYLPWANAGQRPQAFLIRTDGPAPMLASVTQQLRRIDSQVVISEAGPLSDRVGLTLAPQRFRAGLLAGLSALAALLAVFGAYSITRFAVASQRTELAIRLAMGEPVHAARRRVVLSSVRPAAAGAAAGLAVAWFAGRFITALLFEPSVADARLLMVPAVLLGMVTLAALIPSATLSRLDPAAVLRQRSS